MPGPITANAFQFNGYKTAELICRQFQAKYQEWGGEDYIAFHMESSITTQFSYKLKNKV